MRRRILLGLLLMFVIVLSGCAAKSRNTNPTDNGNTTYQTGTPTTRKVVYTVNVWLESKDILEARNTIRGKLNDGDWVQSERVADDEIRLTLRVKTTLLDDFIAYLNTTFKVQSQNISSQDITSTYNNLILKKTSLTKEHTRLLELYETADMNAMIMINKRISEIEAELLTINGEIGASDSLIEYSTVSITIYQDGSVKGKMSYGNMAEKAFYGGWTIFFNLIKYASLAIISLSPFILIGGGVTLTVYLVNRKIKHSKEKSKEAPKEESTEESKEE